MKSKNNIKIVICIVSIIIFIFLTGCSTSNKNVNNESSTQNSNSGNNKPSDTTASINNPDIKGNVTELDGNKINISKITQKSNGTVTGSKKSSKAAANNTGTFEVNKDTAFTIRTSSDKGNTSTDKAGAISDIKVDSLVEVWGEKSGNTIIAKNVIIYIYN
ncbi:hypothetical protein [Clostridium pasteurianum]|uniref:Uncharacterized protein n=1 Tax=Clostridium pasteurianum BC1 TaxID=86416 RepID=R4K6B2_CLOPA|nr:hypothetical protein [Clostridium pasteurianum]AGK96024.1 hypothetical protein Clopa_1015 [Clostridium pasteurianum BC1]